MLAVAPPTTLVALVLVGEAPDLAPLGVSHDAGRHARTNEGLRGSQHIIAVHHHHGGQLDVGVHGSQSLDEDPLSLLDPVLLAAGGNHCVHSAVRLSGAIGGATASGVTVT